MTSTVTCAVQCVLLHALLDISLILQLDVSHAHRDSSESSEHWTLLKIIIWLHVDSCPGGSESAVACSAGLYNVHTRAGNSSSCLVHHSVVIAS